MKCSNCKRYVTNPYKGCTWCAMPTRVRQQLNGLDEIADKCRELANVRRSWLGYETIIRQCAELRIEIYHEAQKELEATK